MKTLFLAWQDKRPRQDGAEPSRGWYPIGRLDAEPREALYRFHYTRGVLRARRDAGFQPLDAFPDLDREYESAELFPLFSNRVPSDKRGDYREFVERLGLSVSEANPFEILAVSGGGRQTDNLEVFPKIQKRRDGTFHCRFFLHGWRHVNAAAQDRLAALREGETLRVALEINNPATGAAIQLQTEGDYHMVGWAPRYLIGDMLQALAAGPGRVSATVARLNPPPAPHNQRVLVEMEGSLPAAFEPMSGEDFQPLAA